MSRTDPVVDARSVPPAVSRHEVSTSNRGPATLQPRWRVLVVVPTYNEAANVAPLSHRILRALPAAEILFIDDNSPDGTGLKVGRLANRDGRLRLLARRRKLGLGSAYLAGFDVARREGFDVVVTMDADLSHDPEHLPELVARIATHDMVIGSRYTDGGGVRNWSPHRQLLSRTANLCARILLDLPVHDCTSGFRAYRVSALRSLPLESIRSSGYSFLEEMTCLAHRHGCRLTEIPIVFVDRHGGRSKISTREIFLAVYHLFRLAVGGDEAEAVESYDGLLDEPAVTAE